MENVVYTKTVDLDEVLTRGRWSTEGYLMLCDDIKNTAQSLTDKLVATTDIASIMSMCGRLEYDLTGETDDSDPPVYAGKFDEQYKVYVDPYNTNSTWTWVSV